MRHPLALSINASVKMTAQKAVTLAAPLLKKAKTCRLHLSLRLKDHPFTDPSCPLLSLSTMTWVLLTIVTG